MRHMAITNFYFLQYYPAHDEIHELMTRLRQYGLYRNEHLDFKEEMQKIRVMKGKVKTRKWATGFDKNFYPDEEDEVDEGSK